MVSWDLCGALAHRPYPQPVWEAGVCLSPDPFVPWTSAAWVGQEPAKMGLGAWLMLGAGQFAAWLVCDWEPIAPSFPWVKGRVWRQALISAAR